jgi:hypothetical protein
MIPFFWEFSVDGVFVHRPPEEGVVDRSPQWAFGKGFACGFDFPKCFGESSVTGQGLPWEDAFTLCEVCSFERCKFYDAKDHKSKQTLRTKYYLESRRLMM